MTEISTPIIDSQNIDTSSHEPTENIVDIEVDTSTNDNEPISDLKIAENEETKTEDNKGLEGERLLAGKYKKVEDLEKGYKEVEKAIAEKSELEKQLQVYREQEEKAKLERETQARQEGFASEDEMKISQDIAVNEFNLFVHALETGHSRDFAKAKEFLTQYRDTGNPVFLDQAKEFFTPKALEFIAREKATYEKQAYDEFNKKQIVNEHLAVKGMLEDFAKQNSEWINSKINQEVVAEMVRTFGSGVNLPKVKELIDKISSDAIENYKRKNEAEKEQTARLDKIQSPDNTIPNVKTKGFTDAQIKNMSEQEYIKNAPIIIEQMKKKQSAGI